MPIASIRRPRGVIGNRCLEVVTTAAATSERLFTHDETLPRCKNGQLRLLQAGVGLVLALRVQLWAKGLGSN